MIRIAESSEIVRRSDDGQCELGDVLGDVVGADAEIFLRFDETGAVEIVFSEVAEAGAGFVGDEDFVLGEG